MNLQKLLDAPAYLVAAALIVNAVAVVLLIYGCMCP